MDITEFAKRNNLARKFEKAIEAIRVGRGWTVFDGLEKGPITVKVIYDGGIRFVSVKTKKAKAKPKPKPTPRSEIDSEEKVKEVADKILNQ